MKNINHLIDIAGQTHFGPTLLLFFVGLMFQKKRSWSLFTDDEITGDNIPVSLMDRLKA